MSASDCFDFWICFRGQKNKKPLVAFYFGLFAGSGDETTHQISREKVVPVFNLFWFLAKTIGDEQLKILEI